MNFTCQSWYCVEITFLIIPHFVDANRIYIRSQIVEFPTFFLTLDNPITDTRSMGVTDQVMANSFASRKEGEKRRDQGPSLSPIPRRRLRLEEGAQGNHSVEPTADIIAPRNLYLTGSSVMIVVGSMCTAKPDIHCLSEFIDITT